MKPINQCKATFWFENGVGANCMLPHGHDGLHRHAEIVWGTSVQAEAKHCSCLEAGCNCYKNDTLLHEKCPIHGIFGKF